MRNAFAIRFPDPPVTMTEACLAFVQQSAELEDFVAALSVISSIAVERSASEPAGDEENWIDQHYVELVLSNPGLHWQAMHALRREDFQGYEYYLALRDICLNYGAGDYWDGAGYTGVELFPRGDPHPAGFDATHTGLAAHRDVNAADDIAALMQLEECATSHEDFLWLVASYFDSPITMRQDFPYRRYSEGMVASLRDKYAGGRATTLLERHRPLVYQTIIARSVDNFIRYLTDLCIAVLRVSSSLELFASERLKISDLTALAARHQTLEELRSQLLVDLTEQQVDKLARENWKNVADWLEQRLRFEPFTDLATHLDVARMVLLRNAIVHHRGVLSANDISYLRENAESFAKRGKKDRDKGRVLGDFLNMLDTKYSHGLGRPVRLTTSDIRDAVTTLAAAVYDIDARAIHQFNLPATPAPRDQKHRIGPPW